MKIEFDSLVLDNFKAFTGTHMLELRDFGDGLHMIGGRNKVEPRLGSNGAGKSTLWDALTWCLYGKTVAGLRNPDVRPWHGKGTTRVSLGVEVNGRAHAITRSVAPNRLAIDRKECGQEQIEKLIGLDFSLFTNAVLLGQGRPLFFDLQPRDKMELFVNALQLDRWDDRASRASDRTSQLDGDSREIEGELTGANASLDEADILIESEEAKAASWAKDFRELMRETDTKLKAWKKQATALESKRDKADLDLEGAETELRHYRTKLVDEEEKLLDADRASQAAELAMERHNDTIHGLHDELEKAKHDNCPTCGQPIKNIAQHRKHISSQIDELERVTKFDTAFEKADKKVKAVEASVKMTREAIKEYEAKANDARDRMETYGKEHATLDGQIKALQSTRKDREAEANPHETMLRTLRKRRAKLIDARDDLKAELQKVQRAAARSKFWIKGFKDVRLFVMEEVLDELEMATNAMLDEAGLIGWRVSYLMEKETKRGSISSGLSIMIRSPRSSGDVKWEAWSGGEGQRLRIVGALALSEVLLNHAGVTCHMEVLDEPTQHLSGEGITDLCEYLSDRARRLHKSIFYIDHQSVESARFSTVTTITRDSKGSRIDIAA